MALCEDCPLREICNQLENPQDITGYGSEIGPDTRAVLDALKVIFTIEAKEEEPTFVDPCSAGAPTVEKYLMDAIGSLEEWGYVLTCGDELRAGLVNYATSVGENFGVGTRAYTKEQFAKRYPWLSMVEHLRDED